MFIRSLVFAAGVIGTVWVLVSIVRSVVIPRPERVWLTVTLFNVSRRIAHWLGAKVPSWMRHKILGAFAPSVLLSLPLIWSAGLIASFACMYWAVGVGSWSESFGFSGSSITTLGFIPPPNGAAQALAVIEALLGLGIVALMISFLPTLYGTFSRREIAVGKLTTRAGEPPNPVTLLTRLNAIGRAHPIEEGWAEWEGWFVELGETHTSFPALIYFRSASPDRSWLTAAETALDTAALVNCLGFEARPGSAELMLRSGALALRSIADFYRVEPEMSQLGTGVDSLSITRDDFDMLVDAIASAGVPVPDGRDAAWETFIGWRMNYDRSIVGLRALVGDLPSYWGSDDDMVVMPGD